MRKKKTSIQKYVRRQSDKRRRTSIWVPKNKVGKRGLETTPSKTPSKTQSKTPAKSPYYLLAKSPATKRFKSSRGLFSPVKLTPTTKDNVSRTSIDLQTSEKCEIIVPTEEDTFEFEPLPDDDKSDTKEQVHISSQTEDVDCAKELYSLVPIVLKELSRIDRLDTELVKFFELVANKKFPLDNIAFVLWMDVVKWFSSSCTLNMRYSEKSKLFWKLGWRIFGKRFVNFMGGFKNHGEGVLKMCDAGKFNAGSSEINFAVPDVSILRDFDPYSAGIERKPGIFVDTISEMGKFIDKKSACITFDGKKIKQGLIQDSGDVDLLGYEKGSTLQERKNSLHKDLEDVQLLTKALNDLEKDFPDLSQMLQVSAGKCTQKCKVQCMLLAHFLL